MFVKPGDSVRFLWFFQSSANGLGVTGLTVTVAVNRGTTNAVSGGSATALDATNQPGWYYYDYTVPAAYYGILAGYASTSDASVSQRSGASLYISAAWVELAAKLTFDGSNRISANITAVLGTALSSINEFKADVSALAQQATVAAIKAVTDKLRFTGGVGVETVNATDTHNDATIALIMAKTNLITADGFAIANALNLQTGDLELVRGDSYAAAQARAIEWGNPDWQPLDLSAATSITFRAKSYFSATIFEATASAVSDTLVRLELTAVQTTTFVVGRDAYRYELVAEFSGGVVATLATGKLHVREFVPGS